MPLHRESIATTSGGRIRPTGGRNLSHARRVAKGLWWGAPRRTPLLTSLRKIAVRWVIIIETWYYTPATKMEMVSSKLVMNQRMTMGIDRPSIIMPMAICNGIATKKTWICGMSRESSPTPR